MKSKLAQVHFNDKGTPVADHFDDVYFSNDSGIDETQHVFIDGNDLKSRWENWHLATFVIAETGFGTGLNFLVAMREFNAFRQANPQHVLTHLYFVSTEKFPLPQQDLKRALAAFPTLQHEVDALAARYPIGLEGCHRIKFDAFSCTLDLWIGDVHELLPQWHTPKDGLIDAWFLDGFAPSKNPDMWTDALFTQMARLSKTGTTFGTFTAAGIVKRGLASAGFVIKKRNGFGRKRDMLTGTFDVNAYHAQGNSTPAIPGPYYRYTSAPLCSTSRVVVVGSGLAAAATCYSLVKRGINTTLCYDQDTLATGASGNPQGGFYPQLHSEASNPSRIQAHSFLYAAQCYRDLVQEHPELAHDFCGVIQLSFNDKVAARQNKLHAQDEWPESLIHTIDAKTVSEIANLPLPYQGLFIPLGGWLSPPQLVQALIEEAVKTNKLTLKPNHRYLRHDGPTIQGIQQARAVFENRVQTSGVQDDETRENEAQEITIEADHIILALGAGAVHADTMKSLPLRPVRGQVEAVPSQVPISQLKTVLCHKGYMTPIMAGRHALGSTYVKNDMATDVRTEETHANLQTHEQALSNTQIVSKLKHDGQARAATRLGSPDHQPVVGALHDFDALKDSYTDLGLGKPIERVPPLPQNAVSVLTCLGSRGLTTAPLMAEVLVSSLCRQPLPLNNDLLNAVNSCRFMVREAIRKQ